ncbi:PilN domain-containing protein [Rhizobium sp. PP-CC-3G-465]|uniref:PilN domain-containing protein n=1 Tax=Rhizobium sp. PP-CC-3G-465 TaxID=2135648 RepID=UPI003BA8713A
MVRKAEMVKIVISRSSRIPFHDLYLASRDFAFWWIDHVRTLWPVNSTKSPEISIAISKRGFSTDGFNFSALSELNTVLSFLGNSGNQQNLQILVYLADDLFLIRKISDRPLPHSHICRKAELDLISQTPFTMNSVILVVPRLQVDSSSYIIVKRSVADDIAHSFRTASISIDQVLLNAERFKFTVSPKALEFPTKKRKPALVPAFMSLLALALCISYVIADAKLSKATAYLDLELERVTPAAKSARLEYDLQKSKLSKLKALQAWQNGSSSVTSVWAELTRTLPDTAFLTELTFRGDEISVTGFAKNPAELIGLVESSQIIKNVRFTAPVVKIPGFDSDRFVLSCELQRS